MKLHIGIDPGSSGGGFAALRSDGQVFTAKMPQHPPDITLVVAEMLAFGGTDCKTYAVVERVSPSPSQDGAGRSMGALSAFNFGGNFWSIQTALKGFGVPYDLVVPRVWQKWMGVKKDKGERPTDWKNRLKAEAQSYFPEKKVTLYMADALLIARYCRYSHPNAI